MKIKTKVKHKINAMTPRLSDEELDPLELDDNEGMSLNATDAYLPWDFEDILDVKKLIAERLSTKQRFILEAFLDGLNFVDVGVTEKYWRYHFLKGIEFIKQELKV